MPAANASAWDGAKDAMGRFAGKKLAVFIFVAFMINSNYNYYIENIWQLPPIMPQMTDDKYMDVWCASFDNLWAALAVAVGGFVIAGAVFMLAQGWGPDKVGRRSEGVTEIPTP